MIYWLDTEMKCAWCFEMHSVMRGKQASPDDGPCVIRFHWLGEEAAETRAIVGPFANVREAAKLFLPPGTELKDR